MKRNPNAFKPSDSELNKIVTEAPVNGFFEVPINLDAIGRDKARVADSVWVLSLRVQEIGRVGGWLCDFQTVTRSGVLFSKIDTPAPISRMVRKRLSGEVSGFVRPEATMRPRRTPQKATAANEDGCGRKYGLWDLRPGDSRFFECHNKADERRIRVAVRVHKHRESVALAWAREPGGIRVYHGDLSEQI